MSEEMTVAREANGIVTDVCLCSSAYSGIFSVGVLILNKGRVSHGQPCARDGQMTENSGWESSKLAQ